MHLGSTLSGALLDLPASDLLTHAVVLGRTGSGKSGLTVALLEEIAKSGASALVLDPKGDLANLALSLTTEDEFRPWADDPVETRLKHGEGLANDGLGFEDVRQWRDGTKVVVYAPGKLGGGGKAVNVFPTFAVPKATWTRAAISRDVCMVLQSLDESGDPYDPAAVFLTAAVSTAWEERRFLPIYLWAEVLANPTEALQSFGGMKLEEFFPKKNRVKLARKLIGFQHAADRWISGVPLDLHALCSGPKPQIAVFSMRHLSEDDRQFFAGMLLNKVVDFMFATEASDRLKLAVVLDEARGYLPPHPQNPATKGPICTLLAQGRAQGVGMVIGTQNPMDLDYKALSNVGTWFVGRLRERDCARDLVTELSNRDVSMDEVADMPQRSFLLMDKRGGHKQFRTRWCLNYLFGPMSGEQLAVLDTPQMLTPALVPRTPWPTLRILPKDTRVDLEEVVAPPVIVAKPVVGKPHVIRVQRKLGLAEVVGEMCLGVLYGITGLIVLGMAVGWILG